MTKSIMIQGTMSNAGKSVLAGGILRVLAQDGIKAAPFKSQNMALNSYITEEGLEIGRAQVMQAEAAGIKPIAAMNPILLKPTNDIGSQVIVNGEVTGVMSAAEYYRRKTEYIPAIMEAYETLTKSYDVIVIEGAGSPAEINLKENDIVNMGLAKLLDAPVLLAGDIDRGGVFAQIVGTIVLLEEEERRRIKGTIINKFRGDRNILKPGLDMLTEHTRIPVCGVVPYFYLDIDDEDSLTERFAKKETSGLIDIAVIRFPRISNFTDFAPLECREEIGLRYVTNAAEFGQPDVVILPGTKSTISDLLWMRQNGLEGRILRHGTNGGTIIGICGGYQMLGESIEDVSGAETKKPQKIRGMGLLPIRTFFEPAKRRTQVEGRFQKVKGIFRELTDTEFTGYEIHMGRTELLKQEGALLKIRETYGNEQSEICGQPDGVQQGNVYGCYIHGLFDGAEVTRGLIRAVLKSKGLDAGHVQVLDRKQYKETQYDRLADIIRENLDMNMIYEIIEKGNAF
ncbi:MAG: cobyric acid synthase [Eubacteriales bacterium]|nr:cobyric acid synthase [Eubacteriales bacterium]